MTSRLKNEVLAWLDDYENGHASLGDLPQGSLSQPLKELNGMTLLHIFALWGYEDAVRHILRHGADVMARMPHGETPLHCCATQKQMRAAQPASTLNGIFLLTNTVHWMTTACC